MQDKRHYSRKDAKNPGEITSDFTGQAQKERNMKIEVRSKRGWLMVNSFTLNRNLQVELLNF